MADFMHKRILSVSKPYPIPEGALVIFGNGDKNPQYTFSPTNCKYQISQSLTITTGGVPTYATIYLRMEDKGTGKTDNFICFDVKKGVSNIVGSLRIGVYDPTQTFNIEDVWRKPGLYRYPVQSSGQTDGTVAIYFRDITYGTGLPDGTVLAAFNSIYFE